MVRRNAARCLYGQLLTPFGLFLLPFRRPDASPRSGNFRSLFFSVSHVAFWAGVLSVGPVSFAHRRPALTVRHGTQGEVQRPRRYPLPLQYPTFPFYHHRTSVSVQCSATLRRFRTTYRLDLPKVGWRLFPALRNSSIDVMQLVNCDLAALYRSGLVGPGSAKYC